MKTLPLCCILAMSLVTMSVGCQKDLHPEGELFTDPTHLPQPPTGCKIVRTTYKNEAYGRTGDLLWEPETITLDDGQKVEVSTITKTTYSYDSQGRIMEVREQLVSGSYRLYKYTYAVIGLITHREYKAIETTKPTIELDTTSLSERGLISRRQGVGKPYLIYNQDDQLISTGSKCTNNTYKDGNLLNEVLIGGCDQTNIGNWVWNRYDSKRFTYNLTRPDLPVIYQFYGKGNRNLPIKQVQQWQYTNDSSPDEYYHMTYIYLFDKQGQVRRRIRNGRYLGIYHALLGDINGPEVTDYEYECP